MRRALNWKQISVLNLLLFGVLATACMATAQQLSPQLEERPIRTAEMGIGSGQPVLATVVPTDTVSSLAATAEVTATTQITNGCPATEPIIDEPPKDPNADPFGQGRWYFNDDRTIWVGLPPTRAWHAGGEKVLWIRPSGTDLEISGRRLDGEAPPLRADIPCCYPTGFQATGLIFPTEGCWEVIAKAGDSQLRFVTQVAAADHPVAGGTCETLADVVQQSDVIAIGRVTDKETEGDYAWHTVSVVETWKLPPGWSGVGDRFSLLQDLRSEPQLAENGRYLLFLQYAPWQLLCGRQSVVTMAGNQAFPLGNEPLWHGGTTAELEAEIERLLAPAPSTPSVEGSRFVLEAFFDAYNRHDLAGVLATLAEPFVYGDCDFARRQMYVFETEDELTTWLNAKFAHQDQFLVEEIIIAPTEGSPPDDPRNTAVGVLRTSTSLQAIAEPRRSLFKIILNPEGNRIQYLNTYGNVECETGH